MRVKIFVLLCSCLILQGCTDATPEITSLSDSVPPSVGRGDISSDSSSDKNSSIEDGAWRIHVPAVARNFTIKGSCDKRVKALEWDGGEQNSWMEVEQDSNVVASDIDCSDGNFSIVVSVKALNVNPRIFQIRARYFAGYLPTSQVEVVVDPPAIVLPQVSIVSPLSGFIVTNTKEAAFVVNGSCSPKGQNVKLNVVGFLSMVSLCSGAFSATLDLSNLAEGALTITAEYSVGGQSSLVQIVEGRKDSEVLGGSEGTGSQTGTASSTTSAPTPTVTPTSTPTPTITPTTTPAWVTSEGVPIINPDNYVMLLQHMDENLNDVTGHTVFNFGVNPDSSTNGGAKKFGHSSAKFNGSQYAAVSDGRNFNLSDNDFTIEMWIKLFGLNPSGVRTLICNWPGSMDPLDNSWLFGLSFSSSNVLLGDPMLQWQHYSTVGSHFVSPGSMITNTNWQHLAAVRKGTQVTFFKDGVQGSSLSYSLAFNPGGSTIHIGSSWGGSSFSDFFNGYMDELRITKGLARYTKNFEPPTTAFSDPIYGLWNVPQGGSSNFSDYGYTVNNTVVQANYSSWRSWADAYNKLPKGQKSYVEMMIDTPIDNAFIFGVSSVRAQSSMDHLGQQGYPTWGKFFGLNEIYRPSSTQLAPTFFITKAKIYIVGIALDNSISPARLWFSVDGVWPNGNPSAEDNTPEFDDLPMQDYFFGYSSTKNTTAPVRILGSPTFRVPKDFQFVY